MVQRESLFVYTDDERKVRARIDHDRIVNSGLRYEVVTPTDPERILTVQFAAEVDDGEAESLAVAKYRGLKLLSDDIAAMRLAAAQGIVILTTLDLLHEWSARADFESSKKAARSIASRASYSPPKIHPLRDWYLDKISDPSN
jgi:predicted nucleic acid-binding protein